MFEKIRLELEELKQHESEYEYADLSQKMDEILSPIFDGTMFDNNKPGNEQGLSTFVRHGIVSTLRVPLNEDWLLYQQDQELEVYRFGDLGLSIVEDFEYWQFLTQSLLRFRLPKHIIVPDYVRGEKGSYRYLHYSRYGEYDFNFENPSFENLYIEISDLFLRNYLVSEKTVSKLVSQMNAHWKKNHSMIGFSTKYFREIDNHGSVIDVSLKITSTSVQIATFLVSLSAHPEDHGQVIDIRYVILSNVVNTYFKQLKTDNQKIKALYEALKPYFEEEIDLEIEQNDFEKEMDFEPTRQPKTKFTEDGYLDLKEIFKVEVEPNILKEVTKKLEDDNLISF